MLSLADVLVADSSDNALWVCLFLDFSRFLGPMLGPEEESVASTLLLSPSFSEISWLVFVALFCKSDEGIGRL